MTGIDLTGKVALVTGASQGIGAATAARLAVLGAVSVLAARSGRLLEEQARAIRAAGGKAATVICDVTRFEDVQSAVDFCVREFGALDILVNNAGTIDPISPLAQSDPAAWGHAIDVNVKGVYHGMRAALPAMERQGAGTIINMSSGAANSALEGWSHYCASKAAVKKLTECGHREAGERGIRIVGLSPGTVATGMMAKILRSGINPVSRLDWSQHIPAEWAAEAVAFLCGPGGAEFAGSDFSIKTDEGRRLVGLIEQGASS